MDYEHEVVGILEQLPSEGEYLDYKVKGYTKAKCGNFIKDVISFLNMWYKENRNRYIIIGVSDNKSLIGLQESELTNDANYQNWIDKIYPRPSVYTGNIRYDNKLFEYICISKENYGHIYEATKDVNYDSIREGQAFYRNGSRNTILDNSMRQTIERSVADDSLLVQKALDCIDTRESGKIPAFIVGLILGKWNLNYPGDIELIESLTGTSVEEYTNTLRPFNINSSITFLTVVGPSYSIIHRNKLLEKFGYKLYDEYLEILKNNIQKIIQSIDNLYDLENNKFGIVKVGEEGIYSPTLVSSLYDFLAFINTMKTLFKSCSTNVINQLGRRAIDYLMETEDWRVWATMDKNLEIFAQINPNYFLDELDRIVRLRQNMFECYFSKKIGIFQQVLALPNLRRTLQKLAYFEEFFSKSCLALFKMALIYNPILDDLVQILLPWKPLTITSIDGRCGVIRRLLSEDGSLGWKLLIRLLPGVVTTSCSIDPLVYIGPKNNEIEVFDSDYTACSNRYFDLVLEYLAIHPDNIVDLLKDFYMMYPFFQKAILEQVDKNFDSYVDSAYMIYFYIVKIYYQYQTISDSEDILKAIYLFLETLKLRFEEKFESFRQRIVFTRGCTWLYSEKGNYTEQLSYKQAVQRALVVSKIEDNTAIEFIHDVEDKYSYGYTLGLCIYNFEEFCAIPKLPLDSEAFQGFFHGIFDNTSEWLERWCRIEDIFIVSQHISNIPLSDDIFEFLYNNNLFADSAFKDFYNSRICITKISNLNKLVKVLIEKEKSDVAIAVIYRYLTDGYYLNLNIISQALHICASINISYSMISELIKYIVEYSSIEADVINLSIKYFNILKEEDPELLDALYANLYNDESAIIDLLGYIYNPESSESDCYSIENNKNPNLALNCYQILDSWKIPTNSLENGNIIKWIEERALLATKVNRRSYFDYMVGKKLYTLYSVNKQYEQLILGYLEQSEKERMRIGFRDQLFNSRGAHYKSSDADLKLKNEYQVIARKLESGGFIYIANIYREVCDFIN